MGLTDHALRLIANFDSPATNLHLGMRLAVHNNKEHHAHAQSAPVDIPNGTFDPVAKPSPARGGRDDYSTSTFTSMATSASAGMMGIMGAGHHPLKKLSLNRCRISDDGLATLANLNSLESLDLSGCDDVTDDGLAALAKVGACACGRGCGCSGSRDGGHGELTMYFCLAMWT